jgi:myo-inositol 2-dehydrogenase / D-chiro-inositol 1-dehydrogenase
MFDIALIGAGRIGRIHARNIASHRALRLRGVIDPMAAPAQELASSYGATVMALDEALADSSITGVVVASATDAHLDQALAAIAAGKTVFCEKPIDLDLARARSAQDRLGGADVPLMLGFNRRFDRHFGALKRQLDDGAIGSLETLTITSHDPAPPPVDYIRTSGGLFKDMAIHDFDMARWLLGEEPASVFAAAHCFVDPAIADAGDVDTARMVLRTASGRICTISNSRRSGYGYDQRVEAFGAKGALRIDNVMESTMSRWGETGKVSDSFQNFFLERYAEAYVREIDHFADMLAHKARPLVGYSDGVAALALAEAAAESVRTGLAVPLC